VNRQEILNKVWEGTTLTAEEELFYLTEIVGAPKDEADLIMSIQENSSDLKIID